MAKEKQSDQKPKSQTDWARVIADEQARRAVVLDDDDTVPTHQELATAVRRYRGQRGPQKTPTKQLVTIRLSSAIVEHFKAKAGGKGWQTQLDRAVMAMIEKPSMARRTAKRVVQVSAPRRKAAKAA